MGQKSKNSSDKIINL